MIETNFRYTTISSDTYWAIYCEGHGDEKLLNSSKSKYLFNFFAVIVTFELNLRILSYWFTPFPSSSLTVNTIVYQSVLECKSSVT